MHEHCNALTYTAEKRMNCSSLPSLFFPKSLTRRGMERNGSTLERLKSKISKCRDLISSITNNARSPTNTIHFFLASNGSDIHNDTVEVLLTSKTYTEKSILTSIFLRTITLNIPIIIHF
jgi:hypothetical protein